MREIQTADAVGHILCHDITRIVRGVTKEVAFPKGHIVREADIPALLALGKDNLFVWESAPGMVHENEGAQVLYNLCAGAHMSPTPVREGKIEVVADCDGLLLVDRERLRAVNSLGQMMIATRHGGTAVQAGDKLAGMRIIPLAIHEDALAAASAVGGPILTLKPFGKKRVSILTTGNEVFYGRIADTFTPVVAEKVAAFGAEVVERALLPDDPAAITSRILEAIAHGADLVLCTGGMSVDPDDRTPLAIKNTGAAVVSYGAPVLPGAMFLLAYYEGRVPILGLPGCVMYAGRTIFDLVLPRVMADVPITADDLAGLGHGGLCLNCAVCTYPNCGFGKGT